MTEDAAVWRRIPIEIINERKLELVDELFAEDYAEHSEIPPGFTPDREGVRAYFTAMHDAFPDLHFEVLQQGQDGDMHFGHIRGSGTMKGDFLGMPASGKSATWHEMHLGRISNGQVTEHWEVVDAFAMFKQLGFIP